MAIWNDYLTTLSIDFIDFVTAESIVFRSIGTRSKIARERLIKLIFLKGAYKAIENHDPDGSNEMFTPAQILVFQNMMNEIMGTSSIWYDSDNGGIWDDSINEGVWSDFI